MTLNATQKNLLFAAGTAAVAAAGPAAPLSALALLAQPAVAATSFTKGRKLPVRIGQAAFGAAAGFVGLCTGILMNPTIEKPAPQVAEAPAPVEQVTEVAEAPAAPAAPVVITPANETPWSASNAPSVVVDGRYDHTQYWMDESPSRVYGEVNYNTDKKSITWTTKIFGVKETNRCDASGTHYIDGSRSGMKCSVSMAGDRPSRVVVTDPSDGYLSSKTTFTI